MSSFSLISIFNSSFTDVLNVYWNSLSTFFLNIIALLHEKQTQSFTIVAENLPESLNFNEFQLKLLKGFTILLFINLLLICIAWRVFGKNICERFMKPATSKAIEELKASVSKLKLPKEHTPRI